MATRKTRTRKAAPKETPAFWLVWRDGWNSTPHVKHASEGEAEREAERMATAHPGEVFFILPATRYAVATINPVAWKLGDPTATEEIPF